jgi:hypothetical protein
MQQQLRACVTPCAYHLLVNSQHLEPLFGEKHNRVESYSNFELIHCPQVWSGSIHTSFHLCLT